MRLWEEAQDIKEEARAWALAWGFMVPARATHGCSPGAEAEAAEDQSWVAGGAPHLGQLGTGAQSGPRAPHRCRPLAGLGHTVPGTGAERELGQGGPPLGARQGRRGWLCEPRVWAVQWLRKTSSEAQSQAPHGVLGWQARSWGLWAFDVVLTTCTCPAGLESEQK